ncbi:hypothetical protein MLD38_015470 [Melastoma candidum]|uniref:Uncharacterized protein n=1 Tax=Melastoma candidum TaxID=119954 RepID=A0ACB9RJW4_9MYRT|nr:hypothetical protein MLD38_015470 [Melastoma candidum]
MRIWTVESLDTLHVIHPQLQLPRSWLQPWVTEVRVCCLQVSCWEPISCSVISDELRTFRASAETKTSESRRKKDKEKFKV